MSNLVTGITSQSNSSIILIQEGVEIRSIRESIDTTPSAFHDNVHITPNYIEFKEASEGVTCRQRITIKNIGVKPAYIRLRKPQSIAFQAKMLKSGVMLNPGLSVSITVIYAFRRPSFLRATIPIEINGKILDYRVESKLLEEGISIEPKSIDFGIVDINYSSGIKTITLKNEGGKSTRFSIDLGKNELEITVKPLRGVVKPNNPIDLTVELMGINEGIFYSEFWIKSVPNIRVPVKINVIVPRLVVYHLNTVGDFILIDFSSTIANTRKYDSFVLRNLSSQMGSYVVLGEIDNEVKCIQEIDRKKYPAYNAFEIRPIQGHMNPMEGIIFEVGFTPTSKLLRWRQKDKEKSDRPDNDFMVFLRIVRVHVTDKKNTPRSDAIQETPVYETAVESSPELNESLTIMEVSSSSSSSSSSSTEREVHDIIRLCLHGEVEEACLKFEPDIVYFGELSIGEVSERVVRILNPLKFIPIVFRFVRNMSVRCYPESMELKPEGSIEVLLKLTGRPNVNSPFEIYFDAVADSYESTKTRRRTKLKVGSYSVKCVVTVIWEKKNRADQHDHSRGIKRLMLAQLLPTRPKKIVEEPDTEIIDRIVKSPKWKYRDMSETVQCNPVSEATVSLLETNTEVLIPLSPLQIYNVNMYPSMFIFGTVALKSHNYRQLVVENKNDFPVMIRLETLSTNCIHFPEGNLIILPAGALATRLIEFCAHQIGKFNGYIEYSINDNHPFQLGVIADIIHKQLSLEPCDAMLGTEWLNEEVYQPLDVSLRIINKLDAKTYFRWEVPATCGYFIQPICGTIRGNSSLFSYVYYKPCVTRSHNTELTLKCESGNHVTVRLSVPTKKPSASFVQDTINIGEIPLNLPTKVIAVLNNYGFVETAYEVDSSSLIHGCSVYPLHGVLTPRGIVAFEINLMFSMCLDFTMVICVTVQGSLNLQLKIIGSVPFPQLKLYPQSISLKRISAAAYQQFLITATNIGTTMMKLNFELQDYPEFRISLSPDRRDSGLGNEDVFIGPGTSRTLHLHFEPIDLASYGFYLPIVINDILGPALGTDPKTLKPLEYLKPYKKYYENLAKQVEHVVPPKLVTISIDCTVAGHVVHFSKLQFHFNTSTNQIEEFCIENRRLSEEKSIRIETNEFLSLDCPFFIQWSDGTEANISTDSIEFTLKQGEKCVFLIEFHPTSPGNFKLEAPIFINNELDGTMFNKLSLIGEYPARSIEAEISEIYFRPVPLDVSIEQIFQLIMRNFDKDSIISARILCPDCSSGVYKQDTLTILFLDEDYVSASEYTELKVKVTFQSDIPVSFRVIIEFYDDSGLATYPITIYATAENNSLTTHAHIRKSLNDFEWNVYHEKQTSQVSKLSETFTDDEDFGDSYSITQNQHSGPRISIFSYLERYSEGSIEKLLESKFKLPILDKSMFADDSSDNKSDEEARKSYSEKHESPHSSKVSLDPLKAQFGKMIYPFFPAGNENDDYEIHMQQTLQAAEEWLYTGPFKFSFYPDIPSGMTISTSKFYPRKQLKGTKKTVSNFEWPYLNVLESLLGQTLYKYIDKPTSIPDDDVDRANYLFNFYEIILSFLLQHGAYVCHVAPQFLLSYDDYVIITENMKNRKKMLKMSETEWTKTEKLSPRLFESRSKQCWLDVILQTYKCFVLRPIFPTKMKEESSLFFPNPVRRSSAIPRASVVVSSMLSLRKQCETNEKNSRSMMELLNDEKSRNNNYSEQEIFLMTWLEYHYEQERTKEWMTDRQIILNPNESKDVADARTIENFDDDLVDSLVLITVTAAYCSFLIEENFNNIYICPRNFEEALHNAVCVINAWRKIRLGFIISPLEIIHPNGIKMLMLVAYLYKTLPTYVPKAKIKFSCPLSEIATRQINFANTTAYNVGFLIVLLGNNNQFFMVPTPNPVIRLNAHKNVTVKLQFHAKKIKKNKAHLLFCGSTVGPHFGRNQVFILEGQTDTLEIANEYIIKSKLYEVIDKTLNIKVPYEDPTDYEIWMSDERPSQPSTLKLTRWSELRSKKIPRRLFLNQSFITVEQNSKQGTLSVTVACIMPVNRKFWIVFQSKSGDFIIQINSHWKRSIIDNIVVSLNVQLNPCGCMDTDSDYDETYPLDITVPIPSRNKQLWGCVAHMFQKTLNQQECTFWSRYLDTHIGLRLIRWLMRGHIVDSVAMEFSHIFDKTVTYNVMVLKSSGILDVPKTFTINDVMTSTENIPMDVRITASTGQVFQTVLTLTSVNGKELRAYTVSFLRT